jgi:hypothetical protein
MSSRGYEHLPYNFTAWGEVAFDLDVPCRLVSLGQPRRQRCLLIFGQLFDRALDFGEFHLTVRSSAVFLDY